MATSMAPTHISQQQQQQHMQQQYMQVSDINLLLLLFSLLSILFYPFYFDLYRPISISFWICFYSILFSLFFPILSFSSRMELVAIFRFMNYNYSDFVDINHYLY